MYSDLLACGDPTSVKLKKVGPVGKEVAAFEYKDADFKNGEKMGKMFLMEYTRITVAMDVVARAVLGEVASQEKFASVTGLAYEKRLVTEALGLADGATNAAIFAEFYRDYLLINFDLNKCGVDHHDFAMRNFLGTVKAVKSEAFDGDSMILSFDYDLSKKFEPTDMTKRKTWLFFNLNRPQEVYFAKPQPAVEGIPTFGLLGVLGIANLFPVHGGAAYVPANNAEALYRCSQIASFKPAQLKALKITGDRPEAVKEYFISDAFREYLVSIRTKTGGALDEELWAKCYGARTQEELTADAEGGEEFRETSSHSALQSMLVRNKNKKQ
jgi:hypothetical protein